MHSRFAFAASAGLLVGACVLDWPTPLVDVNVGGATTTAMGGAVTSSGQGAASSSSANGGTGGAGVGGGGGGSVDRCMLCPTIANHQALFPMPVRTVPVTDTSELQAAIMDLQAGDEVVLQAGATFDPGPGAFVIQESFASPVVFRSSDWPDKFPGPCDRVTLAHAAFMPKIISNDNPGMRLTSGASNIRIAGIEFVSTAGIAASVLRIGFDTTTVPALVPSDIEVHQSYLHGITNLTGIHLNGNGVKVMNSLIVGFRQTGFSVRGAVANTYEGDLVFVNNAVESAGTGLSLGEFSNELQVIPARDLIAFNHFTRRRAWIESPGDPFDTEFRPAVAIKNGADITMTGNHLSHSYNARLLRVGVDTNRPTAGVTDVLIEKNVFESGDGFVDLRNLTDGTTVGRVLLENNLAYRIPFFSDVHPAVRISDFLVNNIIFRHNTIEHCADPSFTTCGSLLHMFALQTTPGFLAADNLFIAKPRGITCDVSPVCFAAKFSNLTYVRNGVVVSLGNDDYPATNYINTGTPTFVDAPNGNYQLAPGTDFTGLGDNSSDLGIDAVALDAASVCRSPLEVFTD